MKSLDTYIGLGQKLHNEIAAGVDGIDDEGEPTKFTFISQRGFLNQDILMLRLNGVQDRFNRFISPNQFIGGIAVATGRQEAEPSVGLDTEVSVMAASFSFAIATHYATDEMNYAIERSTRYPVDPNIPCQRAVEAEIVRRRYEAGLQRVYQLMTNESVLQLQGGQA